MRAHASPSFCFMPPESLPASLSEERGQARELHEPLETGPPAPSCPRDRGRRKNRCSRPPSGPRTVRSVGTCSRSFSLTASGSFHDVRPEHEGLPAVRSEDPRQHPHGRGLARAVRPDEAEDLALPDRQVKAVDRRTSPYLLTRPVDLALSASSPLRLPFPYR